jgi:AGCS family alanine or glycine:cation symporter
MSALALPFRAPVCAALAGLILLGASFSAVASVDTAVEALVSPLAELLSMLVFYPLPLFGHEVPWIVLWLAIAATCFTIYLGFINLRGFGLALRLVRGDYHDPQATGEISHFQAVATAVSGTVGIGNIGGVAVAISIGGPGAAFWLVVAGFLSMSTKLVECTLGVKYRRENPDGSVSGGPMYYLEHLLGGRGRPRMGRLLGGRLCSGAGGGLPGHRQHVPVQSGLCAVRDHHRW